MANEAKLWNVVFLIIRATHDTTTHLYNPHRSTLSNTVKSVTVLQQIKTALRLSQTKKQGLSDVGNTASFNVSTTIKNARK